MKKLARIFLLTIYMPAAIGVGVNSHYCMGELESVKVFSLSDDDCCCGGDDMSGCCEDDLSFFRLDDNSHISTSNRPIGSVNIFALHAVPLINVSQLTYLNTASTSIKFTDTGPAGKYGTKQFLVFRRLLI